MRPRPVGSVVGATAGLAFVLANAGAAPAPVVVRSIGLAACAVSIWYAAPPGPAVVPTSPSRTALRTYWFSVLAMLVAIPVGASIISGVLDRPNAILVWVVFVVGAHFLPFAEAFELPVFRWLSASLVTVSIIGAVPALAANSATAAGWTAVGAGFVLMLFAAIGPRLGRRAAGSGLTVR